MQPPGLMAEGPAPLPQCSDRPLLEPQSGRLHVPRPSGAMHGIIQLYYGRTRSSHASVAHSFSQHDALRVPSTTFGAICRCPHLRSARGTYSSVVELTCGAALREPSASAPQRSAENTERSGSGAEKFFKMTLIGLKVSKLNFIGIKCSLRMLNTCKYHY